MGARETQGSGRACVEPPKGVPVHDTRHDTPSCAPLQLGTYLNTGQRVSHLRFPSCGSFSASGHKHEEQVVVGWKEEDGEGDRQRETDRERERDRQTDRQRESVRERERERREGIKTDNHRQPHTKQKAFAWSK